MTDPCERSPFMLDFLKQVEALTVAFRNLPAEDYREALSHLQNLVDVFSSSCSETGQCKAEDTCQVCLKPLTLEQDGDVSCSCDRRYSADDDSSSDPNNNANESLNTNGVKRSRRKTTRPRRSSELYNINLEKREDRGHRRQDKLPKADEVGCLVVKDFKGDERFQCDQCELKFSYYAALLRHLDSRHKTFDANQKIQEVNKKAVTCSQCGATLSSKGALHAHMQMHAGLQPYHCDICSKKFSLKSNLLRHKRIHAGLKPYQCDICEKSFTEKRSVEVHRRIHTGERPYSCDVCGMRFSQLGSWMGHRDTHKDKEQSRYECEPCAKFFTQKVGLHNHWKRHHEKRRNHKCSQCSSSFYSLEELRLHTLTHNGEKAFLCAECGRSFRRQQGLKNHMKQHQRNLTTLDHACQLCTETFSSSWLLSEHKKLHSPEITGGRDVTADSKLASSIHQLDSAVSTELTPAPNAKLTSNASVELGADALVSEDLSILPKDVLSVYCNDGVMAAPSSHDLLEVIKGHVMF